MIEKIYLRDVKNKKSFQHENLISSENRRVSVKKQRFMQKEKKGESGEKSVSFELKRYRLNYLAAGTGK